jgi:hypothetical protein
MNVDGTADGHGLEDVALDLLDDDDGGQHRDRGRQALGRERDQDREQTSDGRADDQHVRAEEGQHSERKRKPDADDDERQPDQHRVEERDQRAV